MPSQFTVEAAPRPGALCRVSPSYRFTVELFDEPVGAFSSGYLDTGMLCLAIASLQRGDKPWLLVLTADGRLGGNYAECWVAA